MEDKNIDEYLKYFNNIKKKDMKFVDIIKNDFKYNLEGRLKNKLYLSQKQLRDRYNKNNFK